VIAFAIQTAIFDSAGWSAIAPPDLSSHNEVIGRNRMIQTTPTASLPVAVRWGGKWFILDNRWLALVEDNKMHRFRPLFVLNNDTVRQYITTVTN